MLWHTPTSLNYWPNYQVLGSMAPRCLRCWWHHGDWRLHFWQCRWLGPPLDLGSPNTASFPILQQLPLQIRSEWAQNYESNKCCGSQCQLRRSTVDPNLWLTPLTHDTFIVGKSSTPKKQCRVHLQSLPWTPPQGKVSKMPVARRFAEHVFPH